MPESLKISLCDKLPDGMLEKIGNTTLAVDIMYINGIAFMMTTSRAIHFGTAEMIKNEKDNIYDIAQTNYEFIPRKRVQNTSYTRRQAIRKHQKTH